MLQSTQQPTGVYQMTMTNTTAENFLTDIVERLVAIGVYELPRQAVEALALEQFRRQITECRRRLTGFEQKYGMTFDEFTATLRGQATMQQEIDWETWDDARKLLEVRERAWAQIKADATTSG
jgi:hypothetical protein